jgi:hypothetical protein
MQTGPDSLKRRSVFVRFPASIPALPNVDLSFRESSSYSNFFFSTDAERTQAMRNVDKAASRVDGSLRWVLFDGL